MHCKFSSFYFTFSNSWSSSFFLFFIPGNKDIVLELLSTMTKARDIAFVDKVRNNCKKLVEESKNINLFEWGAWLEQWSRPIFVSRWNNSVCLYLFTFSNWYTNCVLVYILFALSDHNWIQEVGEFAHLYNKNPVSRNGISRRSELGPTMCGWTCLEIVPHFQASRAVSARERRGGSLLLLIWISKKKNTA